MIDEERVVDNSGSQTNNTDPTNPTEKDESTHVDEEAQSYSSDDSEDEDQTHGDGHVQADSEEQGDSCGKYAVEAVGAQQRTIAQNTFLQPPPSSLEEEMPPEQLPARPANPEPPSLTFDAALSGWESPTRWDEEEEDEYSQKLSQDAAERFAEERQREIEGQGDTESEGSSGSAESMDQGSQKSQHQNVSDLEETEEIEAREPRSPSVESLTGLTVDEGLAVAIETFQRLETRGTPNEAAEFLRKQRSWLKIHQSGNERVRNLKDDVQDRLDLLQAKMHNYRCQREKVQWRWRQLHNDHLKLQQEHAEAQNHVRSLTIQCAALSEDSDELKDVLEKTEQHVSSLKKAIASKTAELEEARKERDDFKEFAEAEEELATCELKRRKLSQLNKDAQTDTDDLHQLDRDAQTDTDDLHRQVEDISADTEAASSSDSGDSNHTETQATSKRREVRIEIPSNSMLETPPATELLRHGETRWSETDLHRLIPFITGWINSHEERRRSDLTESQLREIIGDGTLSWWEFVLEVEQLGYYFRPDHLAQQISEQASRREHGLPPPNAEVIHQAMRIRTYSSPIPELLRRIQDAERELADYHDENVAPQEKVIQDLQSALVARDLQSQFEQDNEDEREKLRSLLRTAKMESTRALTELKETRKVLRQVLEDKELDSNRFVDMDRNLQECSKHGFQLQAANHQLREQLAATASSKKDLGRKLSEIEAQLTECRHHGEEQQAKIAELQRQSLPQRPTMNRAGSVSGKDESFKKPSLFSISKSIRPPANAQEVKLPSSNALVQPAPPLQPPRPRGWLEREKRMRERLQYKQKLQTTQQQIKVVEMAHAADKVRMEQWYAWMELNGGLQYVPKAERWNDFPGF